MLNSQDNMARLSVQLVTFNGAKYLPYLFASLKEQTFLDWKLTILDNGSADGTARQLKELSKDLVVSVTMEALDENVGFAGGHNKLFAKNEAPFVMLLNQDVYLDPDCFEKVMACMDRHQEAAVVSPRLMKWHFGKVLDGQLEESFSTTIDSLGLQVHPTLRVSEWFSGRTWGPTSTDVALASLAQAKEMPVFGVSGTAPIMRMSAINQVAFAPDEIFDALYGSYKEDVDLAFRLQRVGFAAYVALDAVAYHDRSAALADHSVKGMHAEKQSQSAYIKYHSYKNHLMTLYKNMTLERIGVTKALKAMMFELGKAAYYLITDTSVLRGWKEIWQHRAVLRAKRKKALNRV